MFTKKRKRWEELQNCLTYNYLIIEQQPLVKDWRKQMVKMQQLKKITKFLPQDRFPSCLCPCQCHLLAHLHVFAVKEEEEEEEAIYWPTYMYLL